MYLLKNVSYSRKQWYTLYRHMVLYNLYIFNICMIYLQAKVSQAHLSVNIACSEIRQEARKKMSMTDDFISVTDLNASVGKYEFLFFSLVICGYSNALHSDL